GLLLAPLLEERMCTFSFGNRWYRGLTRQDVDGTSLWSRRNWSLADRDLYQPYRRAHGLFRRAASWTVDAMLGNEPAKESSLGPVADSAEFGDDLLPNFANKSYWQSFPNIDRVFWASFDLKLAFPAVRVDVLRQVMKSIVADVFHVAIPGMMDLASFFLSDNLRLFEVSIRQHLMDRANVDILIDYLCDMLAEIRYVPFEGSDEQFFPNDPTSPNPKFLPLGDGALHPGLPTGLAVSGLLLNVYLHSIDESMATWFTPRQWPTPAAGHPAAFLRFADDMVLLAGSPSVLVEGIGLLMNTIESESSTGDLNLRMNWDKSQPQSVADMLTRYRKPSKRTKPTLAEWVRRNKNASTSLSTIERDAITAQTRGPFVTELVERFSDLGAEKQVDLLPEQAKVRLARLQEIVLLKPDDSVVPRETQLVFAANHLVRAWLPEQDRQTDSRLLAEIRRSVSEAMRCASDKPRLWRAVWRAAVRRPTCGEGTNEEHLEFEDNAARNWLLSIVGRFAESADARRFQPPGVETESEPDRWCGVWPMYSSFQRAAIWRTFAAVVHDVNRNVTRLADERAFAPPHSWLFRSTDEQSLERMVDWLPVTANECLETLYGSSDRPLPIWESDSLAVALMSLITRSAVVEHTPSLSESFVEVVRGLTRQHRPSWRKFGDRLRAREVSNSPTSLSELLILATSTGSHDADAARIVAATATSSRDLLRLMNATKWNKYVVTQIRDAAIEVLSEHPQRLASARAAGPVEVRRELNWYQIARQAWLASGGPGQ
ncbi:MAG: hypothetical protein NT069_01795, partial [Planctomycetota bacterium]|nr:hypothetical protein [Planctomycetota bacterium]